MLHCKVEPRTYNPEYDAWAAAVFGNLVTAKIGAVEAWAPEWWWLAYLLLGLVVGFFAGMLGIGGGVIIVPLLVFMFGIQHFPDDRVLHLALGTSLASIVFTSISSVHAHQTRGAVRCMRRSSRFPRKS